MVEREGSEISSLAARVRTLSPAATLERGYAVVQRRDDAVVVRDPEQVAQGQQLRVRLAHGEFTAVRQE
jgi:exodeoxyribonuclease VII large subunit